MNPVAIFVGVLAWGWLWGIWGLLLGAPLLMVVKAVCDRVDDFKPIGELLAHSLVNSDRGRFNGQCSCRHDFGLVPAPHSRRVILRYSRRPADAMAR